MATVPPGANRRACLAESLEGRQLLSTYWVSTSGNNGSAGSEAAPLQTITYALTKATKPGDIVLVKGGIYRNEQAVFKASGTAASRITLAAAPGATPIVRGSVPVSNWTLNTGAIYRTTWTKSFGTWDPVYLSTPQGDTSRKHAVHKARNQFFANGTLLEEVPRQGDLKAGSFWLDRTNKQVYVWLAGSANPNGVLMEGSNTGEALLRTDGKDHLNIRGLTFEHAANIWQQNAIVRIDDDLVTANPSEYVTAENLTVRHAAASGLGLYGNNNVVRNSKLNDNGQLGLHAGGTGSNNVVQGGQWMRNNRHPGKTFDTGKEAGGAKITRSRGFIVDGVEVAYNRGRGIWFDADNRDAIIRNNRSHHNQYGLHYEISYTATIYNNVMYANATQNEIGDNGIGIYIASSPGCRIFNNTTFGNEAQGISVSSEGAYQGGTRNPRQQDGLDMSAYATQVFNNIVADNQRLYNETTSKLSYSMITNPPIPKEMLDNDPTTNAVVPWAPNVSDYNLFYLAEVSPEFPNGYPYPRKFFNGTPVPAPTPRFFDGSEWATAFADWQTRTGWDTHSFWNQDPRFVDPYNGDFRIATDNPALNAGLFQPVAPVDIVGIARAAGATDIGAHEMVSVGTAPTIQTPAKTGANPVTTTGVGLSVLGADDGTEAKLTYTWSTVGTPPAPVTYNRNGTNAAKSVTATFARSGSYAFLVTVRDQMGMKVTSTVNVTVNQTMSGVAITPAPASVKVNATQQFTGSPADQFGLPMSGTVTWSILNGGGALSSSGLYTAPSTVGTATLKATFGAFSRTASVTIAPASGGGTPTIYQAETLTLGGGTVASAVSGDFTGTGYADFAEAGSSAQLTVGQSAAATATLAIRYANGSTVNRPYTVLVNGVAVGQFTAAPTGGDSTWRTEQLASSVSLAAGANVVRLVAVGTGADLDQLVVTPTTAAPPPPPSDNPSMMTLQAEAATFGNGTVASSANKGYAGTGYADFAGAGSWAQFTVSRSAATTGATLGIRYANGSTANRPYDVLVNGVKVGQFTCAPTGGGSTWATLSLANVALRAGSNAIRLVAVGAGADLDQLTVTA